MLVCRIIKEELRDQNVVHVYEQIRRRNKQYAPPYATSILVGTDNTAFDTIAFYQKCGFRIDHVRQDFFSYIHPPLINNGLLVLDMLVLRHRL